MEVSDVDADMIRDLRASVKECSDRGLFTAAKWSAELLKSTPSHRRRMTPPRSPGLFSTSTPARSRSPHPSLFSARSPLPTDTSTQSSSQSSNTNHSSKISQLRAEPANVRYQQLELEHEEQDALASARSSIDAREFSRVESLLRGCQSSKSQFMIIYSQYLICEQELQKQWRHLEKPSFVQKGLERLLERVGDALDPWLLYLKGLTLSRLSRRAEAIESILLSIASFPWNWASWLLLGSCIDDTNELDSLLHLLPFPRSHPLLQLFQVHVLNRLSSPSDHELALCDRLLKAEFFPKSLWVMSLRATVLYHLHEFPLAEAQFDEILLVDPDRVDNIDIYSNILYVTDNRLKLSRLVRNFIHLERDKPEVCCLVGNHYALRAEHQKAITYFRRATELDRTYLSAWTLMGHEYIEMKNSHASIEAYRRAIEVNRKDYRAWHGLGQAYELLNMIQHSLYYYQYATALKPYDFRLWQAQAKCYEELGHLREAAECLKRALIAADSHETFIHLSLAQIYYELGEDEESMAYHRRVVEVCQADHRSVHDYAKSSIAVAEYHLNAPDGNLNIAREFLEPVAVSNAEDVNRAIDLLKKLQRVLNRRAIQHDRLESGISTVNTDLKDVATREVTSTQ